MGAADSKETHCRTPTILYCTQDTLCTREHMCPSGLRGWTQVPIAQAARVRISSCALAWMPELVKGTGLRPVDASLVGSNPTPSKGGIFFSFHSPTAGMPTCSRGRVIVKGRCLKKCKSGQTRSRVTNRCRSSRTAASKTRRTTAASRRRPKRKTPARRSKGPSATLRRNAESYGSKSLRRGRGGYRDSRGWFYSSAEPWNQPIPPYTPQYM